MNELLLHCIMRLHHCTGLVYWHSCIEYHCVWGDWKRGTGKLGTIIQGVENARLLAMEHRS